LAFVGKVPLTEHRCHVVVTLQPLPAAKLPLHGQSARSNDSDEGTSARAQKENVIVFPTRLVVESV
jgi:hypothetical protein